MVPRWDSSGWRADLDSPGRALVPLGLPVLVAPVALVALVADNLGAAGQVAVHLEVHLEVHLGWCWADSLEDWRMVVGRDCFEVGIEMVGMTEPQVVAAGWMEVDSWEGNLVVDNLDILMDSQVVGSGDSQVADNQADNLVVVLQVVDRLQLHLEEVDSLVDSWVDILDSLEVHLVVVPLVLWMVVQSQALWLVGDKPLDIQAVVDIPVQGEDLLPMEVHLLVVEDRMMVVLHLRSFGLLHTMLSR